MGKKIFVRKKKLCCGGTSGGPRQEWGQKTGQQSILNKKWENLMTVASKGGELLPAGERKAQKQKYLGGFLKEKGLGRMPALVHEKKGRHSSELKK